MDLSGVIFVLLALAWAGYLIPTALKHHDEVARTRSVDRFSTAMRVLARREPVNRKDTRLVVTPRRRPARPASRAAVRPAAGTTAGAAAPPAVPGRRRDSAARTPDAVRVGARREAALRAAQRRRRLLSFLLLCDVGASVAAYLGYVPWWSTAAPGALTVLYLMLCRTGARRARARRVVAGPVLTGEGRAGRPADPRVEEQVPIVDEQVDEQRIADFDDAEDTVGMSAAALAEAVSGPADGRLWDPLPVTLPTYVTKPKARRTVRTIDLGEPGTWTSGRTEQDARIAAQTAADEAPQAVAGDDGRSAVGS